MKKRRSNFFKLLVTLLLAFVAIGYLGPQIQQTADSPAFASMGSTGGGSHSSGSTSGGSHSTYSNSASTGSAGNNQFSWASANWIERIVFIIICVMAGAFVLLLLYGIMLGLSLLFTAIIHGIYSRIHISAAYQACSFKFDLLKANLTIDDFLDRLDAHNLVLKRVTDPAKYREIAKVYTQAQYLYSQDLREYYVDHKYSLKNLLEYLDPLYYWTMKKEIKLKANNATIDETIVSKAAVSYSVQISNNIWVAQIDAQGQDKEVQFNEDFNDSFTRSKWSDYLVYGKNKQGQVKIINLIYGEHFHLDGQDFNDQASIKGDNYEEN